MFSRAVASKVSVVLSLALIVVIVFAFVEKSERQPRIAPATAPSGGETTAASMLAQPGVLATMPVVLPAPPAPALEQAPKALATRAQEAPQSAEIEQKPPSAKRARPTEPSTRSFATGAKASAPHPQKTKSKPNAGRKPLRRATQEKPSRPARSARSGLAAKGATNEEPGKSIVASQNDVAEGRTLLRLLEYGSGPAIELAWPEAAGHRESLFALLAQCFGMQVALIDAAGHLYVAKGQPNTRWNLNLDRFSSFIREPAGELSGQERQAADRIRAHHSGLNSVSTVRVFPRTVDARLLGGLRRLVGESYAKTQAIRARYRLSGRRLVVEKIVADGRMIQGRLELRPVARGACRRQVGT